MHHNLVKQLRAQFDELQAKGAGNADPIRFAQTRSLLQRLVNTGESNKAILKKVSRALDGYQINLEQQQASAKARLKQIETEHKDQLGSAQALYKSYQYQPLRRLLRRLETQQQQNDSLLGLREMNAVLQHVSEAQNSNQALSFDELLFQQEHAATDQVDDDLPAKQDSSDERLELQSMKQFRASMKHVDIDKLIERALNEYPANPGLYNPQMLAVKSLMRMRDLSPAYLRRFAAYIETILWLEKNSAKLTAQKKAT